MPWGSKSGYAGALLYKPALRVLWLRRRRAGYIRSAKAAQCDRVPEARDKEQRDMSKVIGWGPGIRHIRGVESLTNFTPKACQIHTI